MGLALVSGGSSADPRTPPALPGMPAPFLGVAVVGAGGLTAAVDAYGDVVDLRPSPAGWALLAVSPARQAAGTVATSAAIVPRVRLPDGRMLPLWRADSVRQRYRPGTNVLVTSARFGAGWAKIAYAAAGDTLACRTGVGSGLRGAGNGGARWDGRSSLALSVPTAIGVRIHCDDAAARRVFRAAARSDHRWLARALPLGAAAPGWARRLYGRSLLTLRALSGRGGSVAAGARDGWAYVWPRDAGAATLAYAAAGYRGQARQVARFLLGLRLGAAARFYGNGAPVPGRAAQGDASGWVAVAARASGLPSPGPLPWRDRPDYQEGPPGTYLANAIAAGAGGVGIEAAFGTTAGLVRRAGDPGSGLDSAAAWAVRPFPQPALFPAVRRTLLRLARRGGRFGITPGAGWPDRDPWSAPTAWSAWSLAALAAVDRRAGHTALARRDRRAALALLGDLRRAATPAGELPERVGAHSGIPTSTTPLTWSHAFAILALRQLWPGHRGVSEFSGAIDPVRHARCRSGAPPGPRAIALNGAAPAADRVAQQQAALVDGAGDAEAARRRVGGPISTTASSVAAALIGGLRANDSVWCVNSSRIDSSCMAVSKRGASSASAPGRPPCAAVR